MRSILVVARTQLFPRLSPQGFLPAGSVDLDALAPHLFFAERAYMEQCSHFKQIIPYLVLTRARGGAPRVLAYQRRGDHSEKRLGGLWSVGFGGHIEPLDRADAGVASQGLVRAAALRELAEETGLSVAPERLRPLGCINSDREDVSSVHFGVVYGVDLDVLPESDEAVAETVVAQAEPHRVRWLPQAALPGLLGPGRGPDGGDFEDWSRIVIEGAFARGAADVGRAGA
jgi:predicted NUDIX family phosphoesterase